MRKETTEVTEDEETTKAADYMDDIVLGHLLPSSRYSFPSSFTSVYASGS